MDVEVRQMIEDIQKFLQNRDEEYETNKFRVGMKYLFRDFMIRVWTSTNFNIKHYMEYNRVLIKQYIEYYRLCWEHRNKILHDLEIQ